MITYDLRCKNGHEFEGWFKDRKSYQKQMRNKKVICPYCNESDVKMVLTACAIRTKSHKPEKKGKKTLADIQKIQKEISDYVRDNFEYVGSEFASEAKKMHYGESEERSIWGTTTKKEEKELKEEGIKFFKIPKPIKYDS